MALIVKGDAVRLHVEGSRGLVRPAGAMMHDPSGKWWPKNSLLIGRYTAGKEDTPEKDYKGAPREYLGRNYPARTGYVDLPPRDLSAWGLVGEVKRIDYDRPGTRAPGGYHHDFNKPHGVAWFPRLLHGKGHATLYRHGRFYRLDMSRKAILDDRGIVYP